jgi:hypothetical protein
LREVYLLRRGPGVLGRVSMKAFPFKGQRQSSSSLPSLNRAHEVFQAKLEILDLVATERCSGKGTLAFLEWENTLIGYVLDR